MTEAPKGLMTSKELGMAVADRLVQAEKQREVHGGETPPKQHTPMRRALQPPATREQRADRDAAPAVHHSATQKILDEYQPGDWKNPEKSIWKSRGATDEFFAKAYGHPPMTDEEWREFQRIPTMSTAELVQKYGIPSFSGNLPDSPRSPDSKTPKRRTLREVMRGILDGMLAGAASSLKDKPEDKK